jgi:hypothetical protein
LVALRVESTTNTSLSLREGRSPDIEESMSRRVKPDPDVSRRERLRRLLRYEPDRPDVKMLALALDVTPAVVAGDLAILQPSRPWDDEDTATDEAPKPPRNSDQHPWR